MVLQYEIAAASSRAATEASVADRRSANIMRLRRFRAERPEKHKANNKAWREANPEKWVAHKRVEYAVKTGRLVRQPCERCGGLDLIVAHHESYDHPLAVVWLCPLHHAQRHTELNAGAVPKVPAAPPKLSHRNGRGNNRLIVPWHGDLPPGVLPSSKGYRASLTLAQQIAFKRKRDVGVYGSVPDAVAALKKICGDVVVSPLPSKHRNVFKYASKFSVKADFGGIEYLVRGFASEDDAVSAYERIAAMHVAAGDGLEVPQTADAGTSNRLENTAEIEAACSGVIADTEHRGAAPCRQRNEIRTCP